MKRAFTLVEVLVALFVLVIGLAGVMSVIYGSTKASNLAIDQNNAASLLSEAQEDIKRAHCIVPNMAGVASVQDDEVGLYVETAVTGDGTWPNCIAGPYKNASTTADGFNAPFSNFRPKAYPTLLMWPLTQAPRFCGLPPGSPNVGPGVYGYRVLYKLERHPNWITGQLSFENMYVLTMAVYKDLNWTVSPSDPNKKLEQVSEPMVVYVRSKVNQ